ncbi:hypothetical protein D3C75_956080 [compost metagenome]
MISRQSCRAYAMALWESAPGIYPLTQRFLEQKAVSLASALYCAKANSKGRAAFALQPSKPWFSGGAVFLRALRFGGKPPTFKASARESGGFPPRCHLPGYYQSSVKRLSK